MNSDFVALKEHLSQFAENGQLSIFSGNWFDAEDGTGFKLPPELDLIARPTTWRLWACRPRLLRSAPCWAARCRMS